MRCVSVSFAGGGCVSASCVLHRAQRPFQNPHNYYGHACRQARETVAASPDGKISFRNSETSSVNMFTTRLQCVYVELLCRMAQDTVAILKYAIQVSCKTGVVRMPYAMYDYTEQIAIRTAAALANTYTF